ncbi:MAG: hypothetical protein DRJ51_00185 [Thermoprotei archaeon]|nr:MAG: hypothetical protein DRJ51_00185 [Thermoprotei archaeon]
MMDLEKAIRKLLAGANPLIIGVGNPLRSDDGVGVYIANELAKRRRKNVLVAELSPENYIDKMCNPEYNLLLFIDAVHANFPSGSVVVKEFREEGCEPTITFSHRIPLSFIASLVKRRNPRVRVFLLGIQVERTQLGEEISPKVKETADLIVKILSEELKRVAGK